MSVSKSNWFLIELDNKESEVFNLRPKLNIGSISEKRLITIGEGSTYTGLGRTTFRKWAEQIGALRRFGSRVLFDKTIIDRELDREEWDEETQ